MTRNQISTKPLTNCRDVENVPRKIAAHSGARYPMNIKTETGTGVEKCESERFRVWSLYPNMGSVKSREGHIRLVITDGGARQQL
ncbi:hypothetical protein M378DRAFT_169241 [Amanita muscaria Koide BX008]|uniref:Uncharacterized protein n=1 Tax=Amanita muscaria (strain Koide BX008) TaxID=946122 RepID=A0A0C2SZ60_AMAMK|nr:hypothetical protein M378DRAFT_169241 [Amanita muscaria Koide BX008]